jgi:hypothetical protein
MKRSTDIADRALACALSRAAEGVDYSDPASVLMAQEESTTTAVERSDIASLLMVHLFGDGPHPEHVTFRLYRLTEAIAPHLLHKLTIAERLMLTADDEAGREARLVALLRGTRIKRRRPAVHQVVIRDLLNAAWSRQRDLLMSRDVPEAALTDYQAANPSELVSQFRDRIEAVGQLLNYFFLEGAQPEIAVKRVFMVAKAYYEPLVLGMSLHRLAKMFGQVRATWSIRSKKKLNGFLALRGVGAVKAPYQKTDAVCVKYAEAATGNRNRATGLRVA